MCAVFVSGIEKSEQSRHRHLCLYSGQAAGRVYLVSHHGEKEKIKNEDCA